MKEALKELSRVIDFEVSNWVEKEVSAYRDILNSAFSEMYEMRINFNMDLFRWWRKALWTDNDLMLCAKVDGKPIGVLCSFKKQAMVKGELLQLGYIGPMGVLPGYWRRSIGRSMMERLIQVGIDKKLDALTLFADPKYPPHFLYEKLGFKRFYDRRSMTKILDRRAVSTAMHLNPVFSFFLRFMTGVKETKLPNGYRVRTYQTDDFNEVISLRGRSTEKFDYVDIPQQEMWLQKLEEYPKSASPISLVLLRSNEIIGFVFGATHKDMVAVKRGQSETTLTVSVIDDLFFKEDEVQNVQGFVSHALKQCNINGGGMVIHSTSGPTHNLVLKKSGFMSRGAPPTWVMYKPLREGVDSRFESIRSYCELSPLP